MESPFIDHVPPERRRKGRGPGARNRVHFAQNKVAPGVEGVTASARKAEHRELLVAQVAPVQRIVSHAPSYAVALEDEGVAEMGVPRLVDAPRDETVPEGARSRPRLDHRSHIGGSGFKRSRALNQVRHSTGSARRIHALSVLCITRANKGPLRVLIRLTGSRQAPDYQASEPGSSSNSRKAAWR